MSPSLGVPEDLTRLLASASCGPAAPKPRRVAVGDALLVGQNDAASMCGLSLASWCRLKSAGKIGPKPIRLGGRLLWRRADLERWVASRLPDGRLPDAEQWIVMERSVSRLP